MCSHRVRLRSKRQIARAQFNDSRSDAANANASVRLETCPFKPTPHQSDFRLDDTLPRVAVSLNLQDTKGQARRTFTGLHDHPFAIGSIVVPVPQTFCST